MNMNSLSSVAFRVEGGMIVSTTSRSPNMIVKIFYEKGLAKGRVQKKIWKIPYRELFVKSVLSQLRKFFKK